MSSITEAADKGRRNVETEGMVKSLSDAVVGEKHDADEAWQIYRRALDEGFGFILILLFLFRMSGADVELRRA
jgi:hypothetical protein